MLSLSLIALMMPSSGREETADPTPMLNVSGTFCLAVVSRISSKRENFPFQDDEGFAH